MKTKSITLIVIFFILLAAIITNPTADTHKAKVKSAFTAYMQKEMAAKSESIGNGFEALGTMLGNTMVNTMVENMVSSDSYVFFSLTKLTYDGKTKTIGFGAFGNVWLSGDVDKALEDKGNIN